MDDIFSKEFNDNINNMVDKLLEETENSFLPENVKDKMHLNELMLEYLRKMGKTPETYSDVVPVSFDLLDSSTKIRILSECFDKDCVIEKSRIYNSSIEGIHEPDYYQNSNLVK